MQFTLPAKGDYLLMVRSTNSKGVAQPDAPNWNASGFMRNAIESTPVVVGGRVTKVAGAETVFVKPNCPSARHIAHYPQAFPSASLRRGKLNLS